MWFKPLVDYRPFNLQQITIIRVAIYILIILFCLQTFNCSASTLLICVAPLMLISNNPENVRGMAWQLTLGFSIGTLCSLLAVYVLNTTSLTLYIFSFIWCSLWIYLGEVQSKITIACRIISILPVIILNMSDKGLTTIAPTLTLLLLMACGAVWFYKLLENIIFPLADTHTTKPMVWHFHTTFNWHAIQFAVAILLILLSNQFLDLPNDKALTTALVTVAVVSTIITPHLHISMLKRISGNLFGASIAILCLILFHTFPFFWLVILITLLCFMLFAWMIMQNVSYGTLGLQAGYAFIAVNPTVIMNTDINQGFIRLAGVLYGCLVIYVVHLICKRLGKIWG